MRSVAVALALAVLALAAVAWAAVAYSKPPQEWPWGVLLLNGDEDEEDELEEDEEGEEEDELGEELGEGLGEVAWNIGAPAVAAFVAYKHVYIAAAKRRVKLPLSLATALKLHIASSILLGLAALAHGALFIGEAGLVEWAAGGIIALLLVTGTLLYYSKNRMVKRFARLIHAQRLLSIILLVLVAIHVAAMD